MWRKNTWCLALIAIALMCCVSAIRLNEIELNPSGSDAGHEWLELYSDSEVNLAGYSLQNYDNDTINLSGIFSGYFIFNFSSQWLDNADEKVWLLFNGSVVSETPLLSDSFDDIRTWQYCSGSWNFTNATAGIINICTSQNSSNGTSQQNSTSNSTGNASASMDIDYASEVKNGEFEITAKLYNLESKDYDIKVYVTFEENDTIVSETYNENEWKSSTYYIDNIVSGPGNKTLDVKLRIADKYSGFKGDAKLNARLRESLSSSTVANFEDYIKILEKENSSSQSSNQGTITLNLVGNSSNNSSNGGIGLTSNVIKLNSPSSTSTNTTKDIKSNIVYKSKVEYFKEYGFYALGIVCIVIIFVLLRK